MRNSTSFVENKVVFRGRCDGLKLEQDKIEYK